MRENREAQSGSAFCHRLNNNQQREVSRRSGRMKKTLLGYCSCTAEPRRCLKGRRQWRTLISSLLSVSTPVRDSPNHHSHKIASQKEALSQDYSPHNRGFEMRFRLTKNPILRGMMTHGQSLVLIKVACRVSTTKRKLSTWLPSHALSFFLIDCDV